MSTQPKDLTKFALTAEFKLTPEQIDQMQEVYNLANFRNNSVILGQMHNNGIARVRWLSPFQTRVILIVLRLLGIKDSYTK